MLELLFCLAILFTGCAKNHDDEPVAPSAKSAALYAQYTQKLSDAKPDKNGWLTPTDCDGMIWAGKSSYAGIDVHIDAAEYPDQPGRFNRHPMPFCGPNAGSATTWSRDMAIAGLLPSAWGHKDLDTLKRHAAYGIAHNWVMGDPIADGRTVYTPSMIGILYQLIFALGGEDSPNRQWPDVYTSGLTDFEAHLQMMDIWLRGEVNSALKQIDLDTISDTMLQRIHEHADAEPSCPFYAYMTGIYSGNLDAAIDLLTSADHPQCSYVRGDDSGDQDQVDLSEWLFVAKLILKKTGELK